MSEGGHGELMLQLVLQHGVRERLIGRGFAGVSSLSRRTSVEVSGLLRAQVMRSFAIDAAERALRRPRCFTNAAVTYAVFRAANVLHGEMQVFMNYAAGLERALYDERACRPLGRLHRVHEELALATFKHLHRIRTRLSCATGAGPSPSILAVVGDMTNLVRMSGVRIVFRGHMLDVRFGPNSVHPTYSETRTTAGRTVSRVFLNISAQGSSHVEWARREMNEAMPGVGVHGAREVTVHVPTDLHAGADTAAGLLSVYTRAGGFPAGAYTYYPTDTPAMFPLCGVGTSISAVGGGTRIRMALCDERVWTGRAALRRVRVPGAPGGDHRTRAVRRAVRSPRDQHDVHRVLHDAHAYRIITTQWWYAWPGLRRPSRSTRARTLGTARWGSSGRRSRA
jgi:hypothetical protein